ncbi:hypothetical protein N0V84_007813 [Fusarium piperis]|uniref:Uncharacterized protein n=1 Tax=Fusarium piperis TaxID=1435070 RepID=A0A9W9BKY6_9HYPO|nr:hypothetical protein N0V84_007813 [Fusarium piperis]
MNNGVPHLTTPYRQTTPRGSQVGPGTGELSLKAMETLWKILLEPAVMELYPGQTQKDQQVCSMIKGMMPGRREGPLRDFQRIHRTLFQDSNFRWKRMNVVKDTFLTINKALPTPQISGMGVGTQDMTLVSLPIQKLASSCYGTVRSDRAMSLEPLELRFWPDLREFTMACPTQCGDAILPNNKSNTADAGDWGGGSPLDREGGGGGQLGEEETPRVEELMSGHEI